MYHYFYYKFLYLCVVWFNLVSIYFYHSTLNTTIVSNKVNTLTWCPLHTEEFSRAIKTILLDNA